MIDGPLSFLVMLAVLIDGVAGAVALAACLVAMVVGRWRQEAIRAFTFGVIGGLISAYGVGLMALGIHEPGVTEVALKEWLPVMTLAGFGFGAGMSLPRKDSR